MTIRCAVCGREFETDVTEAEAEAWGERLFPADQFPGPRVAVCGHCTQRFTS